MYWALTIMMIAAMCGLFSCGYFVAVINRKYGRSWLHAIPITIALLMFNVIWALLEMAKSGRWTS